MSDYGVFLYLHLQAGDDSDARDKAVRIEDTLAAQGLTELTEVIHIERLPRP